MGGELVSGSFADYYEKGDSSKEKAVPQISYEELFDSCLPYYMAIGMSYDEYWNGDSDLVKHYREAHKLKRKMMNEQLWLQGMYIYEALCDVAPILHAFAKSGTKPTPYPTKPYPISKEDVEAYKKEEEQEKIEKSRMMFEAMAASVNATKFKAKEEENNG